MPFDGKNFTETKLEPFSREDLIAWLETQDPDEWYSYTNAGKCLWAQYTKARGGSARGFGHFRIGSASLPYMFGWPENPTWHIDVANPPSGAVSILQTMGGALARARALQAR